MYTADDLELALSVIQYFKDSIGVSTVQDLEEDIIERINTDMEEETKPPQSYDELIEDLKNEK